MTGYSYMDGLLKAEEICRTWADSPSSRENTREVICSIIEDLESEIQKQRREDVVAPTD